MKKTLVILFLTFIVSLFSVSIYDIQFTDDAGDGTYPSPMLGEDVTVVGIVTGTDFSGAKFFMCDLPEVGIGAWHGIFIYNVDPDQVPQLGDEVEVSGTVTEYYGLTELGYVTTTIISSGNEVPAPIWNSTLHLSVPVFAEQYECCLVAVSNVIVTEGLDDHSQWYIDDGSGECQVDDGFFHLDEVTPPIEVNVDDEWGTIIGILDYSYEFYGINPRFPADMMADTDNEITEVNAPANLIGNFPNPFNPETTVQYSIVEASNVTIEVFNIRGRKVKTLVNEVQSAGDHSEAWNGTNDKGEIVGSGIYFLKLNAGNYSETKKMMLMK